jgi:hypothetical protein
MTLLFSPVYSPTFLLQLQSFFFNCLEFAWGYAPPSLCSGAGYALAAFTSLPFSKRTGGGAATPTFSCWLVYLQFEWGVLLPHSPELRVPCPLCYVSFFFPAACLLFSLGFFFSFFPGWESAFPGGYTDLLCAT